MSKFKEFRKFCLCYQSQLDCEGQLKKLGIELTEGPIQNNIDELISMIPDLLFNIDGVELFWNLMWHDIKLTDEYIDELWKELKEYQL